MRTAILLLTLCTCLPAFAHQRTARARTVTRRLAHDARRSSLRVEHVWEIAGATRGELLAVSPRMTLRGPAGLRAGPDAALGWRARTRLTDDGVEGSLSEGPLVGGTSRVTIGRTRLRGGEPVTTVREIADYTLQLEGTPSLGAPAVSLTPALWAMAPWRDAPFDAAGALADAVNDQRLRWPGTASTAPRPR